MPPLRSERQLGAGQPLEDRAPEQTRCVPSAVGISQGSTWWSVPPHPQLPPQRGLQKWGPS